MLYFAYGSNLSFSRIAHRTPSARFVAVAKLNNYTLAFHKASKDGSGKCDVVPSTHNEDYVLGVVYDIAVSEKGILDNFEELGVGYKEKMLQVTAIDNTTLDVFLYYAIQIDASKKPYHWYKEHVIRGAIENNFEQEYIDKISAIDSINDSDAKRSTRELSIYTVSTHI